MSTIERMWKINKLGKKKGGSIVMGDRDVILDYLYSAHGGTATESELTAASGYNRGMLLSEMKALERRGYVQELTGGRV